jgi:SNF2 family DNA or RNA helicase
VERVTLPEITFADLVVPPTAPELVTWEVQFREYLIGPHRFQPDIDKAQKRVETLTDDIGMTEHSFKILEGLEPQVKLWRHWQSVLKLGQVLQIVKRELDDGLYDKVVLASMHARPLEQMLYETKDRHSLGIVYANMNTSRRANLVEAFAKRKRHKIVVAHIPGMNPAVDLSPASHLVLVDPSWLPHQNEMAVRRLWHAKQKNPVTVRVVGLANSPDKRLSQLMRQALRKACLKTVE